MNTVPQKKSRQIYISGPMTGMPGHNFAAFDRAASMLLSTGWNIVSPADIARENGVKEDTECDTATLRSIQEQDVAALLGCRALYLLKGWQDSKGAQAEFTMAQWLGMEIKYEDEEPVLGGVDPKGAAGSKKAPMWLLPPLALEQTAWVQGLGAKKYGPWNWRRSRVKASTYISAIMRHLQAWAQGEDLDPESAMSHLAHIAAGCNILMDAQATGTLDDDRAKARADAQPLTPPPDGVASTPVS